MHNTGTGARHALAAVGPDGAPIPKRNNTDRRTDQCRKHYENTMLLDTYDSFRAKARDGDTTGCRVAGTPSADTMTLLMSKKNGKTKVVLRCHGNDENMKPKIFHTDDVTKLFVEAMEKGASVADELTYRSYEWQREYDGIVFDRRMAAGEIREGSWEHNDEIAEECGNLKAGWTREFDRMSPVKGASTRILFEQGDDEKESPRVTLCFLWKDKFKKGVCEPSVDMTGAYRDLETHQFLEKVEQHHDNWVGVLMKREKANKVGRNAKSGTARQESPGIAS